MLVSLKLIFFFFFSIFAIPYAYIFFVKDKSSKVKRFLKRFENYLVYLKNRFQRKLVKIWKKLVVSFNIYINKLFIIFKKFISAIQDTRKVDNFLTRIHLRFLMRLVWFYVGFVNYSIILNYNKHFKKSVDSFVEFCKSRAFLFNVKKYKFIYLLITIIITIIIIIRFSSIVYSSILEIFNNFIFYDGLVVKKESKKIILQKENANRLFSLKFKYDSYKNYRFLKFIDYSFLMHLVENNIYKSIYYKKNINSNLISFKFNDNNLYTNEKCEKIYNKFYYIDNFFLKFYEIKGSKGYKNYYNKQSKSFISDFMLFTPKNAKKLVKEPLLKNETIDYSDFECKKGKNRRKQKFGITDGMFFLYYKIRSFMHLETHVKRGGFTAIFNFSKPSTYFTFFYRKNSSKTFKNELFNFDSLDSKNIKFAYFWKQHVKTIRKFRSWDASIHFNSGYYRFRGHPRAQRFWRYTNCKDYRWKELYSFYTSFTDIPSFRSENSTFGYRQYRKFFRYNDITPASSNFFFEIRKFEQLHFYKKLNAFKLLGTKHLLMNQYYYVCEEAVEVDPFYAFLNKFSSNKYNTIRTNLFFENSAVLEDEKIRCKDELDYIIILKKIEQSKKLTSFFYKFRGTFKSNAEYKDLSRSFLNLSFASTCLNNFEKKNKVDYFFPEPLLDRRGSYFLYIVYKIYFFVSKITVFILSIPGKAFTLFTEEIPYKAIYLYIWWLIKGIFNFSHFDNYIYGPKRMKKGIFKKRYFIEAFYLRKELKNSTDMSVILDTPHLRRYYNKNLYFDLKRRHSRQLKSNRFMYERALRKYHPNFYRGTEKLAKDCLLKMPPSHKTSIATSNFMAPGKQIKRSLIYYHLRGLDPKHPVYENSVIVWEKKENKRNIKRLNKRMEKLERIKLKKQKKL